jgi:hypothetical protein
LFPLGIEYLAAAEGLGPLDDLHNVAVGHVLGCRGVLPFVEQSKERRAALRRRPKGWPSFPRVVAPVLACVSLLLLLLLLLSSVFPINAA